MASPFGEGLNILKTMSSNFPIFSGQTTDADSTIFMVSPRDSVGVNDTEHSAYFEIFGGLGGGTLSLQKLCKDGSYREETALTVAINASFPSSGNVSIKSFNFKDAGLWKFVLSGATGASLTITGINMKGA